MLSLYFALRRAEGFKMRVMEFDAHGSLREAPDGGLTEPSAVTVLNLQGELFFAAADEVQTELMKLFNAHPPTPCPNSSSAWSASASPLVR